MVNRESWGQCGNTGGIPATEGHAFPVVFPRGSYLASDDLLEFYAGLCVWKTAVYIMENYSRCYGFWQFLGERYPSVLTLKK